MTRRDWGREPAGRQFTVGVFIELSNNDDVCEAPTLERDIDRLWIGCPVRRSNYGGVPGLWNPAALWISMDVSEGVSRTWPGMM